MPLNPKKGNMYGFITDTFNTVKGECPHGCSYCYMKRYGKQNPIRFDASELNTLMGEAKTIFVGSSCDMFANKIPFSWIYATLKFCRDNPSNQYFFQSKNPKRMFEYADHFPKTAILCTTIESNRHYPEIMGQTPPPSERAEYMGALSVLFKTHVTLEPIIDFDLPEMVALIRQCNPVQVNIGANSSYGKKRNISEPTPEKVNALISELRAFVPVVHLKSNLKRIMK